MIKILVTIIFSIVSSSLYAGNNTLNTEITSLMKQFNIPVTAYAVIDKDKVMKSDSISIDKHINVTNQSIFQAASLSKLITAIMFLHLVGENKVSLTTPINSQLQSWHIPQSAYSDEVTPLQCLNMTSGLIYGKPNTQFSGYGNNTNLPSLKQFLNGESPATNPPIHAFYPPGTRYHYTGAGYMVIQQLIEDVTHQTFQQAVEETIFKPLNMTHSFYFCPLPNNLIHHAIPGFMADGKELPGGWDNIPAPATGGLWSTPNDLAHLLIMISQVSQSKLNQHIINLKNLNEMFEVKPHTIFGLGAVIDTQYHHLNLRKIGYNQSYTNQLIIFPKTGQGFVIMTDKQNAQPFVDKVINIIAKQYHWPRFSENFDEVNIKETL